MAEKPGQNAARPRADVPTPDFYDYAWQPLAQAAIDDPFVVVAWPDGTTLRAHVCWLRENAVGAGVDPATREGTTDPARFAPGLGLAAASLTPDGALEVRFEPERLTARFHPGWLRHVADGRHTPDAWLPAAVPWRAATRLADSDGSQVLSGDTVLSRFANALLESGLARLRGVGTDTDFLLELAGRIGPVRDTNFGPIWDVRADAALAGTDLTNSTANTALRLPPHTDLPTREAPPGFQFLHCLVNDTDGGESTFADGLAVSRYLAEEHPDDFEALTQLHWVFFNRGPGIDHRWSGPIIEPDKPGVPLTLRAFHPVRAFPDMPDEDVPRAYAALGRFSEVAARAEFQCRVRLAPGDLVAFDNRRVLHGRESFGGGTRHLRGIYMDHDDLRSFVRVINRRAAQDR